MKKIFNLYIDGNHGTTGLEITTRLKKVSCLNLLTLPPRKRKDPVAKQEIYHKSDLIILCLPDHAAKEAVRLIDNLKTATPKILDTSTAFRTDPNWTYGHPQLFLKKIKTARKVANPGCYAIGFISLIYPLIQKKILSATAKLSVFGGSGYSGGGKEMIKRYQTKPNPSAIPSLLPYALGLNHKHIPEMQQVCGLKYPPLFLPVVGNYYRGMLVNVPIPFTELKQEVKKHLTKASSKQTHALAKTLLSAYKETYRRSKVISSKALSKTVLYQEKFLSPLVHHDQLEIFVQVRENGDILLCARLDNLGKGAAGNAVENVHLMLGLG